MEGDVNWKLVMGAFKRVGYDDYVITEVEGDEEAFRKTSGLIDKILKL